MEKQVSIFTLPFSQILGITKLEARYRDLHILQKTSFLSKLSLHDFFHN